MTTTDYPLPIHRGCGHTTQQHHTLDGLEADLRNAERENTELRAELKRVRTELAKEDRAHDDTIADRDQAQQMADNLAEAIAKLTGVDIGEHSSMNNPWENALQAATEAAERARRADLGSPAARAQDQQPYSWRYADDPEVTQ